jgi:hypothetical protein
MSTRARRLPGVSVLPISVGWLVCVLASQRLSGRDYSDQQTRTTLTQVADWVLLVAGGFGVALGIVLVKQRRTAWALLAAVVLAAFLGTVAYEAALPVEPEFDFPLLDFLLLGVVLAVPLYAGALVAALWGWWSSSRSWVERR